MAAGLGGGGGGARPRGTELGLTCEVPLTGARLPAPIREPLGEAPQQGHGVELAQGQRRGVADGSQVPDPAANLPVGQGVAGQGRREDMGSVGGPRLVKGSTPLPASPPPPHPPQAFSPYTLSWEFVQSRPWGSKCAWLQALRPSMWPHCSSEDPSCSHALSFLVCDWPPSWGVTFPQGPELDPLCSSLSVFGTHSANDC